MQRIVTIGGGTGNYQILRGLKNYANIGLDAVVSVFDNGGSSGRLREEFADFGILSPGDLRNCLLALTDESRLRIMVELFEHRFKSTEGSLSNHNLGNLIIAAAQERYGKVEGIKIIAKEVLGIEKHRVLPVSTDSITLCAETMSGKTLEGQVNVSYPNKKERIKKIFLKPQAFAYHETVEAIRDGGTIIICPGDLYGSILPNLIVGDIDSALKQSKAPIVYVCNLVTKQGTEKFTAKDFVREIEKYLPRPLDVIVCNTTKPTQAVVDKYKHENSYFVQPNINDSRVIQTELLEEYEIGNRVVARHHQERTARIIKEILERK
jgi:uncharacterized cofD-like protein